MLNMKYFSVIDVKDCIILMTNHTMTPSQKLAIKKTELDIETFGLGSQFDNSILYTELIVNKEGWIYKKIRKNNIEEIIIKNE